MMTTRTAKMDIYGESWMDCYLMPLLNSIGDHMNGWGRRIYLANDLQCLIPMLKQSGFEILLMNHDSINHNPGALWRLMAIDEKEFSRIFTSDTDGTLAEDSGAWKAVLKQEQILDRHKELAMVRPGRPGSPGGVLYPICGGITMSNPQNIDFNAKQTLKGFMNFCILHEHSMRSLASEVAPLHYEGRVFTETAGQHCSPARISGLHFPNYGFDEGYLRNFVYFHLTDRKRLGTVVTQGLLNEPSFGKSDLDYCKKTGNPIFNYLDLKEINYER